MLTLGSMFLRYYRIYLVCLVQELLSSWVVVDDWLVKVSWLGKLVSVFWCVEMDFFSLECNGVSSDEFCNGSVC